MDLCGPSVGVRLVVCRACGLGLSVGWAHISGLIVVLGWLGACVRVVWSAGVRLNSTPGWIGW